MYIIRELEPYLINKKRDFQGKWNKLTCELIYLKIDCFYSHMPCGTDQGRQHQAAIPVIEQALQIGEAGVFALGRGGCA